MPPTAEPKRRTGDQILLRLSSEDAARLRSMAGLARKADGGAPTLGEYIMGLVDGAPIAPPPVLDLREFAVVPQSLNALYGNRDVIRDAAAELRRLGGALRHAFVEFEKGTNGIRKPILDAIDTVRLTAQELERRVNESEIAVAPIRDDLARISRICACRLESAR